MTKYRFRSSHFNERILLFLHEITQSQAINSRLISYASFHCLPLFFNERCYKLRWGKELK